VNRLVHFRRATRRRRRRGSANCGRLARTTWCPAPPAKTPSARSPSSWVRCAGG